MSGETRPVREGDELDLARLTPVLAAAISELEPPLRVTQFPGGHSNLTYLLQDAAGREWVLRRPPRGAKIATAHDMSREHRMLSALHPTFGKVPRSLLHHADEDLLGAPFYVMERVTGTILRGSGPQPPPAAERMQQAGEALVDGLAELHDLDIDRLGLRDLGRPEGYARRQVEGWTRRYQAARTDDVPAVERAAAWLAERIPDDRGAALIHNDYKYDNLVLDPDDWGRVRAILDWEMATVGDPWLDLGTSLGYWIDADDPDEMKLLPLGPTTLPGNPGRREVWERYAERRGVPAPGEGVWEYVYGLFKVAVIAQQIYARWKAGHSSDPRAQAMIMGVQILGNQAVRAIEAGRIDRLG